MNYKKLTLLFILILTGNVWLLAQEKPSKVNVAVDLMSRYVWRGLDYGASPSIQPTLSLIHKNFEIGTWGAISTQGTYSEVDIYAKYSLKRFSLIATDYFFPEEIVPVEHQHKYFNYNNNSTGHVYETALQYKGSENFPVSILASTLIYGADKKFDKYEIDLVTSDTTSKYINNYSTYFELGYSAAIAGNNVDLFMGFTSDKGFYGTSAGIVNLGLTGYRKIKITDSFELPLKISVITNPQVSNIYFVAGFSF